MVDYQDILSRLPLNADEDEVISDPSYILNDVRYPITYLRINDTEACAVVHATYSYSISVEGDVSGCDSKTYVVRVIVIKANAKLENIFIPNSVCTIYGAENVFSINRQHIYVEDDNPFFENKKKNLFSKDGEDLIHGHLKDGDEPSLDGVRTMTANIVLEMGYATDLHREALIATGAVLFVFVLILNLSFSLIRRKK